MDLRAPTQQSFPWKEIRGLREKPILEFKSQILINHSRNQIGWPIAPCLLLIHTKPARSDSITVLHNPHIPIKLNQKIMQNQKQKTKSPPTPDLQPLISTSLLPTQTPEHAPVMIPSPTSTALPAIAKLVSLSLSSFSSFRFLCFSIDQWRLHCSLIEICWFYYLLFYFIFSINSFNEFYLPNSIIWMRF